MNKFLRYLKFESAGFIRLCLAPLIVFFCFVLFGGLFYLFAVTFSTQNHNDLIRAFTIGGGAMSAVTYMATARINYRLLHSISFKSFVFASAIVALICGVVDFIAIMWFHLILFVLISTLTPLIITDRITHYMEPSDRGE